MFKAERDYLKSGSGLKFFAVFCLDVSLAFVLTILIFLIAWSWFLISGLIASLLYLIFATILYFAKPQRTPWGVMALSLIVLGASAYWSIVDESWIHFQRSGSVLVVIAVISFGANYREKLALGIKNNILKIKQTMNALDSLDSSKFWLVQWYSEKLGMLLSDWETMNLNVAEKKGRRLELGLLVLGTIIWGYGDLIGSFLKQ